MMCLLLTVQSLDQSSYFDSTADIKKHLFPATLYRAGLTKFSIEVHIKIGRLVKFCAPKWLLNFKIINGGL